MDPLIPDAPPPRDGSALAPELDITDEDWEFLRVQQVLHHHAKSGTTPPAPPFTLGELIELLENRTPADEGLCLGGQEWDLAEFKIDEYKPCTKTLADLEPAYIRQMEVTTRHEGKYVMVRAVTIARRLNSVTTIVEDQRGSYTQLQVYNLPQQAKIHEILPRGAVICLKEPLFTLSTTCIPGFRVDHLSDMMVLRNGCPDIPAEWTKPPNDRTPEECRELGNRALKEGDLTKALEWYTIGIEVHDELGIDDETEKATLLRNRAHVYIVTGWFQNAINDIDASLAIEPGNEKALFRKAKSLYGLNQWARAGNILMKMMKRFPMNLAAKALHKCCRARMFEEMGSYHDWENMRALAREDAPSQYCDFAEYSAWIEVRQSDISGFGVFTTRDMKAGDLICVSRAVVNCRGHQNGTVVYVDQEPDKMVVGHGPGAHVAGALLERLRKEPDLAQRVMTLHSRTGHDYDAPLPKDEQGRPILDSFIIKDIIRTNSFSSHSFYDEFPETHVSDATQFRAVTDAQDHADKPFDPNCGLWIIPSYFNHSCLPNARRCILGDMMVIRAIYDIPAGTELLISYTDVKLDYRSRQTMFQNSWGFDCACQLCAFEATIQGREFSRRIRLMQELDLAIIRIGDGRPVRSDLCIMAAKIQQLEDYFPVPATVIPRHYCASQMFALAAYLDQIHLFAESQIAVKKALEALGVRYTVVPKTGVEFQNRGYLDSETVRLLARMAATDSIGDDAVAASWKEATKVAYRVVCGEDRSFERTMGAFILRARRAYMTQLMAIADARGH
ncbi:hypothetical protein ABW21_db0205965 [Orbilia brochopaga]|nr:hypothetical protein ABW21_db0205965 [Drechslerella brochopaga]